MLLMLLILRKTTYLRFIHEGAEKGRQGHAKEVRYLVRWKGGKGLDLSLFLRRRSGEGMIVRRN